MTIEIALLTSLVATALSVIGALASNRRTSRKDGIREGQHQATLEHIKSRVDEMWAGHRHTEERLTDMERRITILETEHNDRIRTELTM